LEYLTESLSTICFLALSTVSLIIAFSVGGGICISPVGFVDLL